MKGLQRKLLGLLRLAEGDGPEARSARALAERLAAKYGVNLAEVRPEKSEDEPIRKYFYPRNSSLWRASLGWNVASYTGVILLRERHKKRWVLIGRVQDITAWQVLFIRSEAEIEAEAIQYVAGLTWASRGEKRSEGDTFRKGAAAGFGERLAQYAETDEPPIKLEEETGLILVGRALAVKTKKEELYPRTRTVRVKAKGSQGAWSEGEKLGKSLGVHKTSLT